MVYYVLQPWRSWPRTLSLKSRVPLIAAFLASSHVGEGVVHQAQREGVRRQLHVAIAFASLKFGLPQICFLDSVPQKL